MKIPAGQFKAKCLKIMDEIQESREEVTVTKHGRPVAKLVPVNHEGKGRQSPFGFMKNSVVILGDIVESTGEKWDADS